MRCFAPLACCALLLACAPESPVDDAGLVDDAGVTLDAGVAVDAGVDVDAGVACEPLEPVDGACTLSEGDCASRANEMRVRIRDVVRAEPQLCQRDSECTVLFVVRGCENGAGLARCPIAVSTAQECELRAQVDQLLHEFCTACTDGPCLEDDAAGSCGPARAVCEEQTCRML